MVPAKLAYERVHSLCRLVTLLVEPAIQLGKRDDKNRHEQSPIPGLAQSEIPKAQHFCSLVKTLDSCCVSADIRSTVKAKTISCGAF